MCMHIRTHARTHIRVVDCKIALFVYVYIYIPPEYIIIRDMTLFSLFNDITFATFSSLSFEVVGIKPHTWTKTRFIYRRVMQEGAQGNVNSLMSTSRS